MNDRICLALCQKESLEGKEENTARAKEMADEAARRGADIAVLPEMWNCPYDNSFFREYSEPEDGPSVEFMSGLARKNGIVLVGGSIPEADGGKVCNTCFVFGKDGSIIGKYRKAHLFDINIRGGVSFRESDTLTAGDSLCVIDSPFGKIGIAICYDLRFPKLFQSMASEGADLIIAPANFSASTGSAHWDLLIRSRALDNQAYVAACSASGEPGSKFRAYGHSCIATPWGEFCGRTAMAESIVFGEVDPDYTKRIREELPLRSQQRPELY